MRDSHRMKEKWDLSLDSRQVVSLTIGGVVVLGAVFVLGVVVGKGLAGTDEAQDAPDLLTALDQRAKVSLTFQDELTRKVAPPVEDAPKPLPPPPAPVAQTPPPAPPAAEPVQLAAGREPAPTVVPASATKPAAAVAVAAPAVATASIGIGGRGAVPAPAPEVKESVPEDEPVATRGGTLQDAFARAAAPRPVPPAEAASDGAFTLQLAASQDRSEADRFAARLRDRGYAPYIVTAEVAGKGTFYRVRMGSFTTRESAQRYLSDFKRETKLEAFVAAR